MVDKTTIWKLRQMQAEIRRLLNEAGTPEYFEGDDHHYVVVAPVGGIPAASGSTPGSADCVLSRRWGSGTKTLTDTTQKVKVYNLKTTAISAGEKTLAHRDAWGDFWVSEPTSSQILTFRAPRGGIPAAGSGGGFNTWGSATCDVLNVNSSGTVSSAGTTATVYNASRYRSYLGRNDMQTWDRVGIARKVGDIWVADPDDEWNMAFSQAASSGWAWFNPVTTPKDQYFTEIKNRTFLRFDNTTVNGNKQDAATEIFVRWNANFRVKYTSTSDCYCSASIAFYLGSTLVDIDRLTFCKPASTNNNLEHSHSFTSQFRFDVSTSQNLQPKITIFNGAATYGSFEMTFHYSSFTLFQGGFPGSDYTGYSYGVGSGTSGGGGGTSLIVLGDTSVTSSGLSVAP